MSPHRVLAGLAAFSACMFVRWYVFNLQFSRIPTIGYSEPILSWISAFRFIVDAKEMVHMGYEKYKPGVFKVANIDGWVIIAAGTQAVDEVRKAPDEVLSFFEAAERRQQVSYTLGPGVGFGYHIGIIKAQLTGKSLTALVDDIRDETVAAFNDLIPVGPDGRWVKVCIQPMLRNAICRVSNRLFVGLPLCRDAEWIRLNVEFTIDTFIGAQILRIFPGILRPIAALLFTKVAASHKRGFALVKPLIEARLRMMAEYGDNWEDRPNDFLQWLMDSVEGRSQSPQDYCRRLMAVNFGAIHTSSLNMSQALYRLASNPEWQMELRAEVEEVVQAHGFSKVSIGKMRKIDSFLREQQRCEGLGVLTMTRVALKPFTFSNGVRVPQGAFVSCAQLATHYDEQNYTDADTFNPWRFSSVHDTDGDDTKYQLVATSNDFINFGHGRHACPGRFFAAIELKCQLAHIVLNYDVAFLEGESGYPTSRFINGLCVPADTELMFRKRQF
ncbi:cytochrome P450 [Peniophora sp. CONT]|nr:cytochrome P450 [Peniophora sp. CONT]